MASRKRKAPAGDGDHSNPSKRKAPRDSQQTKHTAPSMRVTRLMKVDGARRAVFNTAELLENIILQLPVRSIYSAYRVCSQWKALVDTSKAVQESLFVTATAPKKVWQLRRPRTLNARLAFSLAPDDTEIPMQTRYKPSLVPGAFIFLQPVKLHPLLVLTHHMHAAMNRLEWVDMEQATATLDKRARMSGVSSDVSSTRATNLAIRSPVLDAQITDPPCKLARITQRWSVKRSRARGRSEAFRQGHIEFNVTSDVGITIRDIIVSLYKSGNCFTQSKHDLEPRFFKNTKLSEMFHEYEEKHYETRKVEDEVKIELPMNVVPKKHEWEMVR